MVISFPVEFKPWHCQIFFWMSFIEKLLSRIWDKIVKMKPWIGSSSSPVLLFFWIFSTVCFHQMSSNCLPWNRFIITTAINLIWSLWCFEQKVNHGSVDYFYTDALWTLSLAHHRNCHSQHFNNFDLIIIIIISNMIIKTIVTMT